MNDILILGQMLLSSLNFKSNSIALKFNIRIYSFTEVHIISSSEINQWSLADVERYSNQCILHGIQSKTVSYQSLTLLKSSIGILLNCNCICICICIDKYVFAMEIHVPLYIYTESNEKLFDINIWLKI